MKTRKVTYILAGTFLMLFMVACDLLNLDKLTTKTLTTEEAKVEIREANQQIIDRKDEMLASKGLKSANYLMELSSGEGLKSAFLSAPKFAQHYSLTKVLNMFRGSESLKSVKLGGSDYYGIVEYNFDSDEFEQVGESKTILKMSYPADEVALNKRKLNAAFTLTNLDFTEIASTTEEYNYNTGEYETVPTTEEFPTNAEVDLTVDNVSELTGSYESSYTNDGLPTSMKMSMETGDYTMDMSYSGSSVNYKTTFDYKLNKDLITGYDLKVKYTSDMNTVETITGSYTVTPLKLDGSVNVNAIETAMSEADENEEEVDLEYLNSQIDVDVIQTEENAKIGKLQYKMYTDPEYGTEYPEIVIMYEDGTYDWLTDVMTVFEF